MKHGFIGFGNLARAIYEGLKEEEGMSFAYFARSRKEVPIPFYEKLEQLVHFSDVLWLAVKPQDLAGILRQLERCDLRGKIIVSPVAGKSIAYIERFLGEDQLIVRIMPNLAMAYRMSVTACWYKRRSPTCGKHRIYRTFFGRGSADRTHHAQSGNGLPHVGDRLLYQQAW